MRQKTELQKSGQKLMEKNLRRYFLMNGVVAGRGWGGWVEQPFYAMQRRL